MCVCECDVCLWTAVLGGGRAGCCHNQPAIQPEDEGGTRYFEY